jgi:nucleoside-diphosphate-sugar epimerase
VLITGAGGFIGQRLAKRLLRTPGALPAPLDELVLFDLRAPQAAGAASTVTGTPRTLWIEGDLTEERALAAAVKGGLDYVFHLARVPGGAAEANFDLGLRANVDGTRMLLDAMRWLNKPPVFVFASTIGVFGVPMPDVIDEDTYPAPTMSYGAQKWIGEILVADYSKRGLIDGRTVRLPGIVARPPAPTGQLSAFISNILRDLSAGREFVCPVAAEGKSWWMSVECCLDNLLHAPTMRVDPAFMRRVWMLPVLHASLGEVVDAIAQKHGPEVLKRVRYQPDAKLQAQFANFPPMRCPRSLAAGFRHDGDLRTMIERALGSTHEQ